MTTLAVKPRHGALRQNAASTFDITGIDGEITPRQDVPCTITYQDGSKKEITLRCRIDTANEVDYYRHGGILHYVLRSLSA